MNEWSQLTDKKQVQELREGPTKRHKAALFTARIVTANLSRPILFLSSLWPFPTSSHHSFYFLVRDLCEGIRNDKGGGESSVKSFCLNRRQSA